MQHLLPGLYFFLLLACSEAGKPSRDGWAQPPNILFILVDDLGPEWISSYGADSISTPHIDALAASGTSFDHFYSMPQCTPSRVSFLTGQYPFRHGWVNHWDVPRWGAGCHFDPDRNASIARILQKRGYLTAAAGKWQINDFRVQPDAMEQHGFSDYCMWTGGEGGNPISDERYWDPYVHTKTGSRTYTGAFGPDLFTDFLIDFMNRHQEQPMFLYYPMVLTHTPLVTTPKLPKAETALEKHKAMVKYMDHCVGRLVNALDSLGIRENTYVFFTTDNGSTRGITGYLDGREIPGGKASLKESGVRQSFIVSRPGAVPEGRRMITISDITDLFPTFAGIGGASLSEKDTLDGVSLLPVLHSEEARSSRNWILAMGFGPAILTESGVRPVKTFTDRVMRNEQYKVWIKEQQIVHLYDLINDPAETEDLLPNPPETAVPFLQTVEQAIARFPAEDASPRYDPMPPQSWDVRAEEHNQKIRR